jgi:hypothetical protein
MGNSEEKVTKRPNWTKPITGHIRANVYVEEELWKQFREFCRKENKLLYKSFNAAIKLWMEYEDRETKKVLKELSGKRHSFQFK